VRGFGRTAAGEVEHESALVTAICFCIKLFPVIPAEPFTRRWQTGFIPSKTDLESMTEAFSKSHHELNYFLVIIVGNASETLNLWAKAKSTMVKTCPFERIILTLDSIVFGLA
jgi:hypothetical protein